ncbi:CHAP domain-containing protein [Neomicrococcus lactis]|uniref:CHAP domain-containing protein n=1 Tax=Neomicrococcus lactis TaxID=732241 RepID=UPI00230143CC|nr:CHAP domain-containing protein [Neomicrococcus lactis]
MQHDTKNSLPIKVTRRLLLGGVAGGAVAGALFDFAPPASAVGGPYAIAFQANTHALWWTSSSDHSQGMMPGTNPTIVSNGRGGYQLAFQANTGSLIVFGDDFKVDTRQGMKAGTSPAIARLSDGRYIVAFQANTGNLYRWDSRSGTVNLGLGMMAGTSPAIAAGPNGRYSIAFQANTSSLWSYDSVAGGIDWRQGLMSTTSPSICWVGSGFQMAFQANTGNLYTFGTTHKANLQLGLMHGTSPVIAQGSTGYRIVFQANTGNLWHWDSSSGGRDYKLGMMAGTNPAVCGLSGGGYQHCFQANTGSIWSVGDAGNSNLNLGMDSRLTSPLIAGGLSGASSSVTSVAQFVSTNMGRKIGDGQCVALVKAYLQAVYAITAGAWGNAVDYRAGGTGGQQLAGRGFTWRTGTGFQNGDILVWGKGTATSTYGHVAVWYNGKIFDQNYAGRMTAGLDPFFTSGFLGYWRR